MSQRIIFIGNCISKRIRHRKYLACAVIGVKRFSLLCIFDLNQIPGRGISKLCRISVGICLCQHSAQTVIGKSQTVLQTIGHSDKPAHGIVLIIRFGTFLIRYLCNPSRAGIGVCQTAIVLACHADQTVPGIIGISPFIPICIRIGCPVSGRIIGIGAGISFFICALCQAIQNIVNIRLCAAQGIGFSGKIAIAVIGKRSFAAFGIGNGNKLSSVIIGICCLLL